MENDVISNSFPTPNQSQMDMDPASRYLHSSLYIQSGVPAYSSLRQIMPGGALVPEMQEGSLDSIYMSSNGNTASSYVPKNVRPLEISSSGDCTGNMELHGHITEVALSDSPVVNLGPPRSLEENINRVNGYSKLVVLSEEMRIPVPSDSCDTINSKLSASLGGRCGAQDDIDFLSYKPSANLGTDIYWMPKRNDMVDCQVPLGKTLSVVYPSYHVLGNPEASWTSDKSIWNISYQYNHPAALSNELSLSLGSCSASDIKIGQQSPYPEFRLGISQAEAIQSGEELSLTYGFSSHVRFSHVVLGSKYLHATREIFSEIATFVLDYPDRREDSFDQIVAGEKGHDDRMELQENCETTMMKKELFRLLNLVDGGYSHCTKQVKKVIYGFQPIISSAIMNIHSHFVLLTISPLYKQLRKRISQHVLLVPQQPTTGSMQAKEKAFESFFIQKQWALHQLRKCDQQSWRPQRGLPEKSVLILRQWMFQNFLHPYPKDNDKQSLARQSGLTHSQVSNWFINARVRLWKPMIEDMCLELNKKE